MDTKLEYSAHCRVCGGILGPHGKSGVLVGGIGFLGPCWHEESRGPRGRIKSEKCKIKKEEYRRLEQLKIDAQNIQKQNELQEKAKNARRSCIPLNEQDINIKHINERQVQIMSDYIKMLLTHESK
jgi:hypothetical protein